MIRPAMLRAAARPIASSTRITVMPLRWASTTKAPTTSSAPPSSIAQAGLRPGEEIDPQLDGYPQLPYVSDQTRSPRGWWDNQMRRNYNEPLHEEADVLGMWGPDVQPVTPLQALGQLTIAFSILGALCLIIYQIQFEPNFVRRSFPYNGLEQQLGGFPARVEQDSEDEE